MFSALSYRLMIITIGSKANLRGLQQVHCCQVYGVFANGLFLGAVILISNKIAGNNRINAKAAGIMMEKGKLVKTIYLQF
ncbi:MAG: hypothetical protein ACLSFA_11875 [Roseburia inulinivorans]